MIYDATYETMTREDRSQIQMERLQSTLTRVYRNVAFYRAAFDRCGIDIDSIRSVKDIRRLPFTTKEDLRRSYPYDMFAVPLRDIVRIHSTVGRTGLPIAIGYTRNDIENWSKQVARVLAATGVTENDFVQIAFDYHMFTGAFGLHYGAERIGASVIPSSQWGNMQRHVRIMKDYKSTVLLSPPSYALRLAATLVGMGIHPEELNLRIGIFGAEPWGEATRGRIEEALHIKAYNLYGINEMMGPGVAGECVERSGLHVSEDHYIIEIVDPASGEPLPHGAQGELVITTITREGFPLIRYRTGDLSSIIEGDCPCGRTTIRMERVSGRIDDLIVVNGISLFPSQIRDILKRTTNGEPRFNIIIDNHDGEDALEIQVAVTDRMFDDEIKKLLDLKGQIAGSIEREIGVQAGVTFIEQGTLQLPDGQGWLVTDRR